MLQYLLDTNIVIYTIKNRPAEVRAQFMLHEGRMAISSVTLGELVFGAERSSQPQKNLNDVESLAALMEVLCSAIWLHNHYGRFVLIFLDAGRPDWAMPLADDCWPRQITWPDSREQQPRSIRTRLGPRIENWAQPASGRFPGGTRAALHGAGALPRW